MYLEELKSAVSRYENGEITPEQVGAEMLLLDRKGFYDVYSCDRFAVWHIANKLSKHAFETTDENEFNPCPVSVLNEVADILAGRKNAYFHSYCGINWQLIKADDSGFERHCDKRSEVLKLKNIIAKIQNDSEPDENEIMFMNEFPQLETGACDNAVNIILEKIRQLWNTIFGNSSFDGTFEITPVFPKKFSSDINKKLLDEYIECYLGNSEFLAEVTYNNGNPQVSFTALIL